MYFDRRLWTLTRGLRGWIAFAVLLGLVASVVGIARFAILGVLLSRVLLMPTAWPPQQWSDPVDPARNFRHWVWPPSETSMVTMTSASSVTVAVPPAPACLEWN